MDTPASPWRADGEMEWNGMEWHGMVWDRVEWNGIAQHRMELRTMPMEGHRMLCMYIKALLLPQEWTSQSEQLLLQHHKPSLPASLCERAVIYR